MANPSHAAIAAIRGRVQDWAQDDGAILAGINAPTIPNPTPCPQVRRPLTVRAAMKLVSPQSQAKVYRSAAAPAFAAAVNAGDLAGALNWLALAAVAGDISQAEYDEILAAATATVPDPAWQPLLSWAQANIGRPLDVHDIRAARP